MVRIFSSLSLLAVLLLTSNLVVSVAMRAERAATHSALKQLERIQRDIDHLKRVNDLAVDDIGELKEEKGLLFQELEPWTSKDKRFLGP